MDPPVPSTTRGGLGGVLEQGLVTLGGYRLLEVLATMGDERGVALVLDNVEIPEANNELADLAALGGHMGVLHKLAAKGIRPRANGIMFARQNRHDQVLKWAREEHRERESRPTQNPLDLLPEMENVSLWVAAIIVGDVLYLEGIEREISDDDADRAARYGSLEVLRWMKDRGVEATARGALGAAINGHDNVLQWLGIDRDRAYQEGVNFMAAKGHLDAVKKLTRHGWVISQAMEDCAENVQAWLQAVYSEYLGLQPFYQKLN